MTFRSILTCTVLAAAALGLGGTLLPLRASNPGQGAAAPVATGFHPTQGPPGTVVTITGSHLSGTTAVHFGDTASSAVSVDSDTTVRATVPNDAHSGPITVYTTAGTASTGQPFAVTAGH